MAQSPNLIPVTCRVGSGDHLAKSEQDWPSVLALVFVHVMLLTKRLKVKLRAFPWTSVVAAVVDRDGLVCGAAAKALEVVSLEDL